MVKNIKNKKTLFSLLILFFIIAIGATIAYFQSTASFENEFNYGVYDVYSSEVFESPDNWKPGEEIPKTITTKNDGTIDAAVRVSYTEKWEDSEGNDITDQIDSDTAIINFDNQDEWVNIDNYYYYIFALEPGEVTSSFIKSVTLNSNLNDVVCSGDGNTKTCEAFNPALGAKYILTITKETAQYDRYYDIWSEAPLIEKLSSLSFETSSFKAIVKAVKDGKLDSFNVGDTKIINLGTYGNHTIRIANMSTPEECSNPNFSQTACGFVIEFADVITNHRMNPFIDDNSNRNGNGNYGGWEYSDMRAFLNSKKFLEGTASEIDYTTGGIYNSLPEELRDVIIDTTVVSGHGSKQSTSTFITTDKLYLLSTHEVYEDVDGRANSGIDYYDSEYFSTRQLDYYKKNNVTTSNFSLAIKGFGTGTSSWWWLRSPISNSHSNFIAVTISLAYDDLYSRNNYGVSPAFRIG